MNSAWIQRLSYVVLLISSLITVLWLLTGYKRSLGYRGSQLGTGRITALNILLAIFSGLSSMLTVQLIFHLAGFSNAALMTYDTALTPLGLVALVIAAPVTEELVFRGAILRSLLGWTGRHWVAIAVSAVLFAAVHFNPAQMPHALLVGLLLGWMYYRTGSVVPGVAFHWANNTIAYVLYNIMPNPDATLLEIFRGDQTAVWLSLLFSLCFLGPAILQLNLRLKKADSGVACR